MIHQIMPPDRWVYPRGESGIGVRFNTADDTVSIDSPEHRGDPFTISWALWLQLRMCDFTSGAIDSQLRWKDLVEGDNPHRCYVGHCPEWPDDVAAAATVDADER